MARFLIDMAGEKALAHGGVSKKISANQEFLEIPFPHPSTIKKPPIMDHNEFTNFAQTNTHKT